MNNSYCLSIGVGIKVTNETLAYQLFPRNFSVLCYRIEAGL